MRLASIGAAIGYVLFLSVSVACVVEIGIRVLMPQTLHHDVPSLWAPDEDMGWRRKPNQRLVANTGERDAEICTDAQGSRISCAQPVERDCASRVLVAGDSFVEALAIPFEDTAWAILETKTGACLDVAGVGGYVPSQYLRTIEERLALPGASYQAVILSIYANDFGKAALEIPSPRTVQSAGEPQLFPRGLSIHELRHWLYPYNQILESRSHAYVALRFLIRRIRDPGDVGIFGVPPVLLKSQFNKESTAQLVEAYTRLHERLRKKGIPLIISVLPFRNQALDPEGENLKQTLPEIADDLYMGFINELFIEPLQNVDGLIVVDLLPGLLEKADAEHWGTQDRHLSPKGHALWAELLLPALKQTLVPANAPVKSPN